MRVPSITLQTNFSSNLIAIDDIFTPTPGPDSDVALARAIMVALNTDRLAAPDDTLPDDRNDDRRGWWGDMDAETIRGGWPIGTRLWLMTRDKITDSSTKAGSTIAKATLYIKEAIDPFVAAKICSTYDVNITQTGPQKIEGTITIYRGPKSSISLYYEDLWS